MKNMIYTHDEASHIVQLFEEVLGNYDIKVPSPEDDEREDDNAATLYGSVYSDLLDDVEFELINLLERAKCSEIVPFEYSGTY